MKIGSWEIRRNCRLLIADCRLQEDGVDRTPALAVPLTEPWWLAVHQILNDAELETIKGARRVHTGVNSNATIAAVGASEGVDLVRQKLNEARDYALKLTRK
jgi:hypothetical protein